MSSGHGPVIEHKTYIAAHCIRCNGVALKMCIVHDACEWKHDTPTCDRQYRELLRKSEILIRDANGPDFLHVLAEAKVANERIKARA